MTNKNIHNHVESLIRVSLKIYWRATRKGRRIRMGVRLMIKVWMEEMQIRRNDVSQ